MSVIPDDEPKARPSRLLAAAITGALISLAAGFVLSYLLAKAGFGVVSAPGQPTPTGQAILARAGLSFYASQHIALIGAGRVLDGVGGSEHRSALVALPLTIWVAVPILALVVGGSIAARMRKTAGRWRMIGSAILSGVIYAAILGVCAIFVRAGIDSFLIPEVGGVSANPPPVPFHPSPVHSLVFGGGFGIAFSCLGALIAIKFGNLDTAPGVWWAAAKAAVVMAIAVQLVLAGALAAYSHARARSEEDPVVSLSTATLLPAASGLEYALMHGITMRAGVESKSSLPFDLSGASPFSAGANLYQGMNVNESGETKQKSFPLAAKLVAAIIGALAVFCAGRLAVRWGSRDGAFPAAFRLAIAHTVYLAGLMAVCGIRLISTTQAGDISTTTAIFIRPVFSVTLAYSALGVLVISFLGALTARVRRSESPIGVLAK